MLLDAPIGISDFRELREKGLTYVDKSGLIIEMLDRPGAQVLLLPRPRRSARSAISPVICIVPSASGRSS